MRNGNGYERRSSSELSRAQQNRIDEFAASRRLRKCTSIREKKTRGAQKGVMTPEEHRRQCEFYSRLSGDARQRIRDANEKAELILLRAITRVQVRWEAKTGFLPSELVKLYSTKNLEQTDDIFRNS